MYFVCLLIFPIFLGYEVHLSFFKWSQISKIFSNVFIGKKSAREQSLAVLTPAGQGSAALKRQAAAVTASSSHPHHPLALAHCAPGGPAYLHAYTSLLQAAHFCESV